jgi:hypothetical protein
MKNNIIIKEEPLRTLAKSYYWQALYHRVKDLSGSVCLFNNKIDFTNLQLRFLQHLEIISGLYMDLLSGEDLITEEVINDWIRAEAYLLYKKNKKDERKVDNIPNGVTPSDGRDKIVFLNRNKKDK